jgi:hypothetical protein
MEKKLACPLMKLNVFTLEVLDGERSCRNLARDPLADVWQAGRLEPGLAGTRTFPSSD